VIADWLAGLALVLMRGPVLMLLGLFVLSVVGLACYGWGRRDALREVDEGRAQVRAAVERALAKGACLIPGQRDGER
jgi:hypothetical protein